MKMSDAQLRLLRDIALGPHYVADYYPPAKVLVRLGFAEWLGHCLGITPSGREELNRQDGRNKP